MGKQGLGWTDSLNITPGCRGNQELAVLHVYLYVSPTNPQSLQSLALAYYHRGHEEPSAAQDVVHAGAGVEMLAARSGSPEESLVCSSQFLGDSSADGLGGQKEGVLFLKWSLRMPEGQGHLEPGGGSSRADTAAPRMAPTCHNTQQCKHHANQDLGEHLFQAGSVAAPGGRVDLPGLSQTQSQKDSTSLSKWCA